jgi:hypothetical protein
MLSENCSNYLQTDRLRRNFKALCPSFHPHNDQPIAKLKKEKGLNLGTVGNDQ